MRESDVDKIAYNAKLYVSHLTKYLIALKLTIAGLLPMFSEQPNIIFIMADDMGYGDVQALNPQSTIPTPNLDRLSREGMTFTDAHSPSAVCTPTRYGVLTGRYCWRSDLKRGVLNGYGAPIIEEGSRNRGSSPQESRILHRRYRKVAPGFRIPENERRMGLEQSIGLFAPGCWVRSFFRHSRITRLPALCLC